MSTPEQTLRNMTADELADHVAVGGTLPPEAVKHLVIKLSDVHRLAAQDASTTDLDDIADISACPLADWVGV